MYIIKQFIYIFYKRYRFLKYYFKNTTRIPFNKKIWCLRKGFFPRNFVLYNFNNNDYKNYVTDYAENFKTNKINTAKSLINNKLIFNELAEKYVWMPDIKGIIIKKQWIPYGKNSCSSWQHFYDYLTECVNKGVILKPIEGDGGIGIAKVSFINENVYQWNQIQINKTELTDRLMNLEEYLVTDLVIQHDYANLLYSKSVNTIRILTMIDKNTNRSFIAAAAHRMGNDTSYPVDNCAKGGFTSKIDIETGILSKAVRTYFKSDTPTWYSVHPDNNEKIEGVNIPNWKIIKSKVLVFAENLASNPYLGWDIVVLENGDITILEANEGADLKLHQVHEPLLKNDHVKCFYHNQGVI